MNGKPGTEKRAAEKPFLPKIVSSFIRAFPVAQIRSNLHKIVYSRVRAFTFAQIMTIGLL